MASDPETKRVDEATKCQVTFAKRRSCLIRKANEISVFCDVDVALVAFSPCGRVSKFCSRERIEDVLERYIKLAPEKRYQHVRCLEWKLEKMKQLDHIKGEENKMLHLDNQIKNLELQIKKATIELEILQTNLKEYEVENEEDASLAQILWCEKNLKNSLQKIKDRKKRLANETYPPLVQTMPQIPQGQIPFAYNFTGNQVLNRARPNLSSSGQYLMPYDPRTWPYRVPNGLLVQLHQSRGIVGVPGASSSCAFNPVAGGFPAIYYPGHPPLTQQTGIPPIYPPIQHQALYWGQTAPSFQNLRLGVFGNSSMHQPITGNPSIPLVPYQPLGALGTSILHQPIMPAIVDPKLGLLGSSSVQQLMRDNQNPITPGFPNQQPGALVDSFLDRSLMVDSLTPNVQFQGQQSGVLGSTTEEKHANNEPSGAQENPTPTSYHNYNCSDMQNDASLPPMSELQVDLDELDFLCSPTQDLDVTTFLNSEMDSSEPFFSNDIGSITTANHGDGDNINEGISGGNSNSSYSNNITENCDTNEKLPADPTQENPPPESPTDSMFLNSLLDEAMMANATSQTEGNQDDSFMDWDGFTWAENLNLKDLDIMF